MKDRPMTWEETFMAIRQGDIGTIIAFTLECLIMLSPILIAFGVWFATKL